MSDKKIDKKTVAAPKKRGLAWLFGFSDLKNGIVDQASQIKETGTRFKKMYAAYKTFLPQKNVRRETFAAAVERLNLTDEHLNKRRNEYLLTAALFTLALCLSVYFLFVSLFDARYFSTFSSVSVSLFISSIVFYNAFRAWQIKSRKLASPAAYIRSIFSA